MTNSQPDISESGSVTVRCAGTLNSNEDGDSEFRTTLGALQEWAAACVREGAALGQEIVLYGDPPSIELPRKVEA